MARSQYVWGIDIGKCGLKALRCRAGTDPGTLIAEAFEYIEYPMILTQPEADAPELIRAALEELLGRHDLRNDTVAVAVPGHLGLSKFIKLPPIEAKKIPDIVKYEARQQIPFPLEQVVWRWQRLAGGVEESGFVIDSEVALFAMKREQVYKALAPLTEAGIRVDVLQLAPIALANMAMFDQLGDITTHDPDNPHPSVVLVSMGVDSTDLVVTNGHRIWQRNMPIGGSSFTKALVQGMKLTFARAETLKRNAVKAEDPKTVFKTMRPVFNEFAGELQRSLNYFTGTDRTAKIGKVLLLGDATKLRGLTEFVAQQLQLDVQRLEKFERLEGPVVASSPTYRDHQVSCGIAYGLALQAASQASISTNLVPNEIVRDRIIESKKPWAVAAILGLLAAAMLNFFGMFAAWTAYAPSLFTEAFGKAEAVKKRSAAAIAAVDEVRKRQTDAIAQQQWLRKVQDRRFQTLDMIRAVEALLPHDPDNETVENPADRNELHIDRMDCEYFPDLAKWFEGVKTKWADTHIADDAAADDKPVEAVEKAGDAAADGAATAAADGSPPTEQPAPAAADPAAANPAESTGPTGPGWVIELRGYHYHNESRHKPTEGAQFLRSTIVKNLLGKGVKVTATAGPLAGQEVSVADLGIGFPVIVSSSPIRTVRIAGGKAAMSGAGMPGAMPAPVAGPGAPGEPGVAGPGGSAAASEEPQDLVLKRYDFVLQFCWQPKVPGPAPTAAPAPAQ
jgi:type IV pilus assembly protein PilM